VSRRIFCRYNVEDVQAQEMKKYQKYIERAKKLKLRDAKIIPAKSIVVAEWVRLKCQFGCDGYGECLSCPPNSPTPEKTRKMLTHYKYALLIHGDEHTEITDIVAKLERMIFLDGYHKAFAMGAGPCELCSRCAKLCRHSDRARPAMEACGIDVYSTARANGLPIKVLKTNTCKGNYYGVVLIE
jgi:predicted metal-binding protein